MADKEAPPPKRGDKPQKGTKVRRKSSNVKAGTTSSRDLATTMPGEVAEVAPAGPPREHSTEFVSPRVETVEKFDGSEDQAEHTADVQNSPPASQESDQNPEADAASASVSRPQSGRPQSGRPQSGRPQSGRPQSGRPQSGRPQSGRPQSGRPQSGRPQSGRPQSARQTPEAGSMSGENPPVVGSGIWQADTGVPPEQQDNPADMELTLRPEAHDEEGNAQQGEIDFPTAVVHTAPPAGDDEKQEVTPQKEYQTLQYEKRNFDSLDPKDYGIEFDDEEFQYEPPGRDTNLPDLYRLMASLEDGESDLETQRDPPSLFTQPEHVPRYKKISELKLRLEEEDIPPYVDLFEEGVKDDVLMIGAITLEDVQEEELRLRDEHIKYQEQEARLVRDRQQEVIVKEEEAKKRVARDLKEKRRLIKRREEILQQRERLMLDRIHKAFRRAENQLISKLNFRKGEVTTMYGDLTLSDGHYGGSKGRRWKVDWEKTPQPVQIKLRSLRGIRDKLPGGRYVLMVSLYNRLGGHVLRWSSLKGQQWGGTTLPLTHDGHFYNSEIKMDQSVFTVLPSKPGIRPGMVLVFELFLLRGATVPTDRVVSWGCFPITDGRFDVVEGKYKAPFLRGEMDPEIDKHEKLEELISSDIDHWMANLYFEIVKLPRYLAGQKEYEVELQFSSGMLSYPDRVNTGGEEYRDGEVPVPGSAPDVSPQEDSAGLSRESDMNLTLGQLQRSSAELRPAMTSQEDVVSEKLPPYRSKSDMILDPYYEKSKARPDSTSSESLASVNGRTDIRRRRPMTTIGSRKVHRPKKVKVRDGSDESDYDEENVYIGEQNNGFYPVKGQPGMYYKKYPNNPVDEYHKQLYTLLPKTPVLTRRTRKKRLTYQEQLEEHTYAVMDRLSDKGHLAQNSSEKMAYVGRQFLAELGLSQWRSREFWGMIIMFILIFFLRLYLHYVGQWLLLQGLAIPINKLLAALPRVVAAVGFYTGHYMAMLVDGSAAPGVSFVLFHRAGRLTATPVRPPAWASAWFELLPYTVNLNYQNTLLSVREEIGIVLIGPFFIIALFALLVFLVWVLQKLVGNFPDMGCKFVIVFGIEAFLDWLLILIIDAALQRFRNLGGDNPIADFAKLYWNFYTAEGSGTAGILITVFLYLFCCFTAGAILYMYFLRLHNNGRMLDIYWRLHGHEDMFFVPYDLEVSNQELSYVVKHAEQWRGEEGERRKVAVYDYIWEEETIEETVWDENGERVEQKQGKKEVTTHISIHTVHLDGLRELYRHFLRLPDGAIVEVFGDMAMSGVDKDMSSALTEGTQSLEKVLQGSQSSLNKIPGRQTAFTNAAFNLDEDDVTTHRARPLSAASRTSRGSASMKKSMQKEALSEKV